MCWLSVRRIRPQISTFVNFPLKVEWLVPGQGPRHNLIKRTTRVWVLNKGKDIRDFREKDPSPVRPGSETSSLLESTEFTVETQPLWIGFVEI